MIEVRTDRNSIVVGQTRRGKTTLALALAGQAAASLLPERIRVINPRREADVHAFAEHYGIEEIVPALTAKGGVDPALGERLRQWFGQGNILLIVDELQMVSRAGDPDPSWRYWFTAGNGRGCAVWACCTRAAWVPAEALTEADHVWSFALSDPGSQAKLRSRDPTLAEAAQTVPEWHFAHHQLGGPVTVHTLTPAAPAKGRKIK